MSLPAGRPEPVIVIGVPATAMSGVVLRSLMSAAGLPGSTTGPGRAATPGIPGAESDLGSADASDGSTSSASSASEPTAARLRSEAEWLAVVIGVVPSRLARLRDDRDDVVEVPDLAAVELERDANRGVTR